jgi:hypothetical protein
MTTAKQEATRLSSGSGLTITRRTVQKHRQGRKAATERVKNALAIINKE